MAKRVHATFTPTAAQWDPETLSDESAAPGFKDRIQFWQASGTMTIVPLAKAKELVKLRCAFVGGPTWINAVHDGIDGRNA